MEGPERHLVTAHDGVPDGVTTALLVARCDGIARLIIGAAKSSHIYRSLLLVPCLAAISCCKPQPGTIYALDCSDYAATGTRRGYESPVFGSHPGLVVIDEAAGKIFIVSENIDGPVLRDASRGRMLPSILKFSPSGAEGHFDNSYQTGEFVYDRRLLRFTLHIRWKGTNRSTSESWQCKYTGYPTNMRRDPQLS